MKLKAFLAMLLILLVLCGCTPQAPQQASPSPTQSVAPEPTLELTPTPDPSPIWDVGTQTQAPELPEVEPFLTLEEYPIMDGSTANLPLMAAVMACATGIPYDQAVELSSCTTTPYAYLRMINNNADILLVYEGSQFTMEEVEMSGVALKMTPIGRDALVFIGNEANPVKDLSQAQLLDIYTGKTTNWAELGGDDNEIIAFQRSQDSGSQALFIKLLMKDVEPMQAPVEFYPDEMAGLIEMVADYNDDGGAIGFSVYYYANYMYTKPGLKFFSVDGVTPSDASIASGEYPFLNPFFVVIREDEPEDSPARKLYNWLLSDEGMAVVEAAGYIPVTHA